MPGRGTNDRCQWQVNGECRERAERIVERRKQRPTDPDYNIGPLRVCQRHFDEASRHPKGYPYDVGPIIPCDYHESCLDDAGVKLFLASIDDPRSLDDARNYCDPHAEAVRKTYVVNKEERILTSSRKAY